MTSSLGKGYEVARPVADRHAGRLPARAGATVDGLDHPRGGWRLGRPAVAVGRLSAARALAGLIALAVILRVASALVQGDQIVDLPGIFDQVSYDALARRVLSGHGFTFATGWWPATRAGQPTAHWSFLYTLYLAGVYALFGPHPLAARLIQALVAGLLLPWLSWRLGRRLFGTPAGLAAAALAAGYPYFVYYAGALVTETFTILAVLGMLDLVTGPVRAALGRPGAPARGLRGRFAAARPWLLLGLVLGAAVLLRQVVLLVAPVLFAWLLWTARRPDPEPASGSRGAGWRPVVGGLLVTLLVMALMIVPWTVRNYQAFGRFVLLNTNAGYVFFWANHPIYGTSFVSMLPGRTYGALIPPELRGLDEASLEAALFQRGLGFVGQDPGRYALLSLSRVPDYFQFWPSPESGLVSNLARSLSFGVCLPFILFGLFLASVGGRRYVAPGQRPAVALLGLFVVVYSLIHLLSWALIRYRLPVDAVLLLFAGPAVVELATRRAGQVRRGST